MNLRALAYINLSDHVRASVQTKYTDLEKISLFYWKEIKPDVLLHCLGVYRDKECATDSIKELIQKERNNGKT